MNNLGETVWSKLSSYQVSHNSLQYSPKYQMLHYTASESLEYISILNVHSIKGAYLQSYQVPGFYQSSYYHGCSLSKDESAFFCNMQKSTGELGILRYDKKSKQIDVAVISNKPSKNYYGNSILAISRKDVLYGYKTSRPDKHHFVKAAFAKHESNEYLLIEQSHQSILVDTAKNGIASRLDEDDQTVWHAIILNHNIAYFQVNLTDSSLVGAKHASNTSQWLESRVLGIEVDKGVV